MHDTLRGELRRREPDLEPELHRRASVWHLSAGEVDRAVQHALAAGDVGAAAEVVWGSLAPAVAAGDTSVLERSLSRFTDDQISGQPQLALTAAGCELVQGQGHLAAHWASVAADAPRPPEWRGAIEAGGALVRAALAGDDPARMREEAGWAYELQRSGGACRALASFFGGVASHLLEERAEATRRLEEGARDAAVRAPLVHALCLSALAVLARERGDWDEVAELSTRARAQVDRHALRRAPASAIVLAVSAEARAHRGRIEDAQRDLQDAARLQASLTDFAVWYRAEVQILLAQAALRLSDASLARVQLKGAARLLRRGRGLHVLQSWLGEAQVQLAAFTPPERAQPTRMTAAELRILRYLPTHLSFREIAERTQVSSNTVKTQANAIYRKFGVACRSDAVATARTCGLLDD